ncbi:LON peptidase substrate-binding domain-containing protein [Algihabitans albus]|uniref:LON peptidase substrate-binding domain-containing protein n=1 Tax=Algihabitans albus TaxID=2164067 RepID=UPI000E5D4351|nr:LON peptidase substrate-binding domain-containing protein [Algihabitans albus]
MKRNSFDPDFENLPEILPIFPLSGVLLLPGGRLPLNVFEPRYLAMARDAIASDRLIGMVQPVEDPEGGAESPPPHKAAASVYEVGCAGRITAFSETDDGRLLITLSGLARFRVVEELELKEGYRRVRADWSRWREDLQAAEINTGGIDRPRLMQALRGYFANTGLSGDWDAIEETPDERLITSLAMICPFEPSEKQALLEATDLSERARTMTTIMEMSTLSAGETGSGDLRH